MGVVLASPQDPQSGLRVRAGRLIGQRGWRRGAFLFVRLCPGPSVVCDGRAAVVSSFSFSTHGGNEMLGSKIEQELIAVVTKVLEY